MVHIFNRPISDEPTKSLGMKTYYMPKAVVWLVDVFNCLAYDWTTKDEWKIIWNAPKQDIVKMLVGVVVAVIAW